MGKLPKRLTIKPNLEELRKYINGEESFCPIAQAIMRKYNCSYASVDSYSADIELPSYGSYSYRVDGKDAEALENFVYQVDDARANEQNPFFSVSPNAPRPTIHFVLDTE